MKDAEGEDLPPASRFFAPPEGEHEPREIADRLVAECEEFAELRLGAPLIMFLMRAGEKVKAGKAVLGEVALPRFMGPLGPVGSWLLAKACGGAPPDFLMILDAHWWSAADPARRAALVHHELKHIGIAVDREGEKRFDDDGDPVWALVAHDLEEFSDTVRRFGAWSPDIPPFAAALKEGGAAP